MNTPPNDDSAWVLEQYDAIEPSAPAAPAPQPIARKVRSATDYGPLAEATREMFRRERAKRAELERELASLRDEVRTIRAEIAIEGRMRELAERLDRVEGTRSGLRAV